MPVDNEYSILKGVLNDQNDLIRRMAVGQPLTDVLNAVTTRFEDEAGAAYQASVFLLNADGLSLSFKAGKRLEPDFIADLNGLQIGPGNTTIGQAAYTCSFAASENIENCHLWKNYASQALRHGIVACWSLPLFGPEKTLAGIFAVFSTKKGGPDTDQIQQSELSVHNVQLVLAFSKVISAKLAPANEKIKLAHIQNEERFQNLVRDASIGIIVLMGRDMIVDVVNEMYGKLISRTPEQLLNLPLFRVIPEAEATFRPLIENVLFTGESNYLYEQPYHVVAQGRHINGYLNIIYQPYLDADGTIVGVMVLCHDITELVVVRKKIERSEAGFREMVMQAPVAMAVFKGKELVADIVNDLYLPLTGKSREEFIGMPLFSSFPQYEERLKLIAQTIFTTGKPVSDEFTLEIRSKEKNETHYYSAVWKPLEDNEGLVEGLMVVANDVSVQVEARHEVEESVQKIRSVIEAAPFPIGIYVGREMRIQFANRTLTDVWGKGPDVVGKTYAEVLPELENQNVYKQLDRVFTSGVAFHAKGQRIDLLIGGHLQTFYFNYSFTPLFDLAGKVYGVMNTAAEVTELVNAYKNLELTESRARLAVEASGQGTFDVNLVTNEMEASSRMAEIFEVSQNAERERYISAFHPEDLIVRAQAYERAFKSGVLEYDGRIVRKNGCIVWIRVKGMMYFDHVRKPERLAGVVQDITEIKNFSTTLERKVAERTLELEEANNKLARFNDELQQFAYVTSHDLQEPLRKIKVFSRLANDNLDDRLKAGGYLNRVVNSADRMTGLIQSILHYALVTNKQMRYEQVDLNALLKAILTDNELLIAQKDAQIELGPLPVIEAIPLQMNQLFFNLVGNALKFSKRGIKPHIRISARVLKELEIATVPELVKGKRYVEVRVEDNGIGFDQAYASKIFTVFQRLNSESAMGGYGIGLALCKKVVDAHNGQIMAEGRLNVGASFLIILPIEQLN